METSAGFLFVLVNLRFKDSHDGEEAGREAGDEIFSRSSADDGVVGSGDSRAVVSRHHQAHLDELTGVARQPARRGEKKVK